MFEKEDKDDYKHNGSITARNDKDGLYLSRSYESTNSKGSWFHRQNGRRKSATNDHRTHHPHDFHVDNKWTCVSPMTQHVIREPETVAAPIRRRRSRSFNDYVEEARREQVHFHHPLSLPSLNEVVPPANHHHDAKQTHTPEVVALSPSDDDHDDDLTHKKESQPKEQQMQQQLQQSPKHDEENPIYISIMYGLINATIVLPVVMSFGNIIYQDGAFAPYMPVLIKLTLVSGVIHQLCFSTLSSLTFAVGSVQDAGLIFLSAMASDMVQYCREKSQSYNNGSDNVDDDDSVMLATVTIGLGVATAILGLGLIVVGKMKLAGYVQMLPTCVVAGYLAFIGLFCGKSGVGLMASGTNTSTSEDTTTLQSLVENTTYVLPGILGGIFTYWSVRTFRHVAVLPTCIAIQLLLFYTGLVIAGSSIEKATTNGWIRQAEPAPVWYRTWDYLDLSKVLWSALPRLLLTEISMIFVVALSSSLDVAAIELELKRPLNYNKELTMVGISNVVSGLSGGYTGSYIFSQSIFSLRSGIRSRLAGFVLASCQVVVIVTPIPILSYVPNFFYGSLLSMICIDLMYEWLWDFRTKVTIAEYTIGLSTFALIQILGVEYGILVGVAIYVVCRQLNIDVGELKMVTSESSSSSSPAQDTGYSLDETESSQLISLHDHTTYNAL